MKNEKLNLIFSASIYYKDKKPIMQLRRVIKDEKLMKQIAKKLNEEGKFKIEGELKVRNPISARIRLKEAGLI